MILGMELENVNTHVHTRLEFVNGVIVLLGENGVGKSTVRRMIGHALFDYISASQGEFVSDLVSGKSGSVRIWLKGRDGVEYIVDRNVGGSTKYQVLRMPGYKRVEDLKNKESILKWLKDQFGMDPDYDLATIFQHAVGVDQGAFTAPFLFTPAERKAIFNPILKLDVYDTLVEKFHEINKVFEQKHALLETEIGKLKVKIGDKKELSDKKAKVDAHLAQSMHDLAIISKTIKDTKALIDGLKKQKDKIEKLEREKTNLEKSIVQNDSQLKEKEKQIQAARAAKAICMKAEPGYTRSLALKEAESAALEDVNALAKANDLKSAEQNRLVKIQSEIEQVHQSIADIKEKMKELPALRAKQAEYARHEQEVARLQGLAGKIAAEKEACNAGTKELSKMEATATQLETKLKGKGKYEKSVAGLAEKRARESRLQKEIGEIGATITEYKRSKKESKGGQCPFLHDTCKNIHGESLEAYFQALIDRLAPKLAELEHALQETKADIKAAEQDEQLLKSLEADAARKVELDRQIQTLREQIQKYKESISTEAGIKESLKIEASAMASLQPSVTQLGVIESLEKQLPVLERRRDSLDDKKKAPEAAIKALESKIQALGDVQGRLATIRGQLKQFQADYDAYQSNINVSNQLASLESSHAILLGTIDDLKKKDGALQQKIDIEKQSFDPVKLASLEDDLNQKTKIQGSLEGEIKQESEILADVAARLDDIKKNEEKANALEKERSVTKEVWEFGEKIRSWYKLAGPKLADVLLAQINISASRIFRALCGDTTVDLKWTNDFGVQISTPNDKAVRTFNQLSGGEQMMAAIAVRLALLQRLSNIRIAFFDEPTGNLDVHKKRNLASVLENVRGFNQLFVISHDSTFEGMANQVIKLVKDTDGRTRVIS